MDLATLPLTGGPTRAMTADGPAITGPHGVLGVDVATSTIDDRPWTVVQVLLDDDHPLFDPTLLDAPMVAEVRAPDGSVVALEPFDHEAFRQKLRRERDAGESTTRGVLVTTQGDLPPPFVRLAFLPIDLAATAGTVLAVHRTTVATLVSGIEAAFARGEVTDDDRRALLVSIEQRHPTPGVDPSPDSGT
jgi:hypothetical protein